MKHLRNVCKESGVRLRLAPTRHVRWDSTILCNGYFSMDGPELAVATQRPEREWLSTIVHESCHLDQWQERSPAWIKWGHAASELFSALDDANPITRSYIPVLAPMARDFELDCELRALKKMKEWELPIDRGAYIRGANAYVWFYTMIPELLSWYPPGKEPYNDRKILALCPDRFLNYYDDVPEELQKEYRRLVEK